MKELLAKYESQEPEIIFEWNDSETEARAWLVINSLRGGAAGGGTRMRKNLDKHEVIALAKTMEIKFSTAGPPIGGAKSGIDFDPEDPRKAGVLQRWFKAIAPLLKSYYGTGGDLNVNQVTEVIPYTEQQGLWHPQEGVLMGHHQPKAGEKVNRIGQLRGGVLKTVEDANYSPAVKEKYLIADLITGFGVSRAIKHFYEIYGGALRGKKVIVQGWGNVGSTAAYFLAKEGAKIVGIIDTSGGIIRTEGLSVEEVRQLYINKKGNKLSADNLLSFEKTNREIWDTAADIFIPCAASRLITKNQSERMIKAGVELISPGANVPFADEAIFFGAIADYTDNKISVIPDFISNLGIARVFSYLMEHNVKTDEEIFKEVSDTIAKAIQEIHNKSSAKKGIFKRGFEIALNKLI